MRHHDLFHLPRSNAGVASLCYLTHSTASLSSPLLSSARRQTSLIPSNTPEIALKASLPLRTPSRRQFFKALSRGWRACRVSTPRALQRPGERTMRRNKSFYLSAEAALERRITNGRHETFMKGLPSQALFSRGLIILTEAQGRPFCVLRWYTT